MGSQDPALRLRPDHMSEVGFARWHMLGAKGMSESAQECHPGLPDPVLLHFLPGHRERPSGLPTCRKDQEEGTGRETRR